jgi:hypothetical protein
VPGNHLGDSDRQRGLGYLVWKSWASHRFPDTPRRRAEGAGPISDPDCASEATVARFYLFCMDAMMFSRSTQVIVRLFYQYAANLGIKNNMILFRIHMIKRQQLKMRVIA